MKKKVYRIFWAWQFEEEEKWLNHMSSLGYQLTAGGFLWYLFDEGAPGEYIYRLEMLNRLPSHAESEAYIRFVEEMGAEHIYSFKNWVYFRKKSGADGFELYSDLDSRIKHLRKIRKLMNICELFLLIYGMLYSFSFAFFSYRGDAVSAAWYGFVILTAILLQPLESGRKKIRNKIKELEKERSLRE